MKNNILYISNSAPNKLNSLLYAFSKLCNVDVLYREEHYKSSYHSKKNNIINKLLYKIGFPPDNGLNKKILLQLKKKRYNCLFVVKGNCIYPRTIRYVKRMYPKTVLVSWSLDDMFAKHNRSRYYSYGIKYYNYVFTTKSYNCGKGELPSLGAQNVTFIFQAYDKNVHRPDTNSTVNYKFDVIFIGYAERERFNYMNYLASNGIEIHVFGSGWDKPKYQTKSKLLNYHFENLLNEDYSKVISNAKIALCFLRKINRDLHTSRSLEIPACRTLMIAERTNEHLTLFKESEEAIFFETKEELLTKTIYYLNNNKERQKVAENGYNRCLASDYSYDKMATIILKVSGLYADENV